jgi:hypothetical protein
MKQLGAGEQKVEDLGYKKENHGFAEMSQNPDDGEGHSREVTVRVSDEDTGRVPVV